MSALVDYTKRGAIGVITVNNPPVNALSPGVPEGIYESLQQGMKDPEIKAMVLIGGGRSFIAGADIKHVGKKKNPIAAKWRDEMEKLDKPVIAAIHGYALGGGLESAMCCHYRLAVPSAKVGLPEVLIGILPGGGGTQRLPRLIGPKKALELIVTGRHVPAPEAAALGIIDELVAEDKLLDAAVAYAEKVADVRPLPRVGEMDDKLQEAKDDPGMFDAMRKKIARRARNQVAPYQCIKCIEAAVELPLEEGLERERMLFAEISQGDETAALKHVFWAEREALKVPDVPRDTPAADIRSGAVIGAGTMGGGIAMCFANVGIPVKILEKDQDALDQGIAKIKANYEVSVKRGSLDAAEVSKRMALIEPVLSYDQIGDADIVIEAVYENLDVKKEVFQTLDSVMKEGAILASNTSTLDIDAMAAATKRPGSVIGTHFFSPANVMKLLEIVRGKDSSHETIATSVKLGRTMQKVVGVCGNCDGFLANRSRIPFKFEMTALLEEGVMPEQVDKVMYEFGYPMGPFAVGDLSGLDIGYATRKRRAMEDPENHVPDPISDALVEAGRLGQKTGAGYFKYEEGDRTPRPDPEVRAIIESVSRQLGNERRDVSDEEILNRILLASVNECGRILEEGIAYRASDIDVMWINGFGFPRYRGGLMYWADTTIGVKKIYETLCAYYEKYGGHWKPAKLIEDLAKSGKSFADV
ncbi:MAG: 3-hydroxyacyl-CoA dehydrogenase NAD-binding domain-containing protein [Alphaproteobacteria bacterium]|nr:3-hydroxyacyl-CoA dehydrogenase NAD-binding domain-containing protein [Alphaproteobacteria bacterium]